MKLSDFDYHLPPERIAQTPVEPRHASRLLTLNRRTGEIGHSVFSNIGEFLNPGDILVVNQTRVIPARLFGRKADSGGQVELLLLNRREELVWEALVGGKRLTVGRGIDLEDDLQAEIIEELDGPRRLVRFSRPVEAYLKQHGHTPLPPYIHETLDNPQRYQTVYAAQDGSAAAPTAGLHFTPELLAELEQAGVGLAAITLHVGLDTFAPVTEENLTDHHIHTEWREVTPEAAAKINQAKAAGGRVVAVGTTSVRTLESAAPYAGPGEPLGACGGATDLYILPGYEFKVVDAIITNFHLPRSTLLALVSAFAGRETIFAAYQTAIQEKYRFYSFGDAMLLY